MGAGFLTLPKTFDSAGWVFSSIYMAYAAFQSYYLGLQLIEVMSKGEVILRMKEDGNKLKRPKLIQLLRGRRSDSLISEIVVTPEITDRRLDISELVKLLFGKTVGYIYSFMLFVYLEGAMTGYAGIFASSLSAEIPLGFMDSCNIYLNDGFGDVCYRNYWIFLAIFSVCMFTLVILGLKKQVWVQTILAVLRFITIGTIIVICFNLISNNQEVDSDKWHDPELPDAVNYKHIGTALSNVLFAFVYQVQFLSIAEFVADRKRHLVSIVKMVSITCFIIFLTFGIVTSIALSQPEILITLNFQDYSAGNSKYNRPWWTYIISYFLISFPAADVFSSFPLMAIAVSDNLMSLVYGASNTASASKTSLYLFRVLVCGFPLLVAFFVYDLGIVVELLSVCSFFCVPIMIPLMHIAARHMVPIKGFYDAPNSPKWLSLAMCGFSVVLLIVFIVTQTLDI